MKRVSEHVITRTERSKGRVNPSERTNAVKP